MDHELAIKNLTLIQLAAKAGIAPDRLLKSVRRQYGVRWLSELTDSQHVELTEKLKLWVRQDRRQTEEEPIPA